MSQQPVRDALKHIAGYGIKKLIIAILFFAILVNVVISVIAGFVAADGEGWKPFVAVPISALVLFVVGIIVAVKFAVGLTVNQGIIKADLVRVTVNAILNRFDVESDLGLTRLEFDNHLNQALQKLPSQSPSDGKLSWIAEKVRNKVLKMSAVGITRFADTAFKQSERVSIQSFRNSAADSINSKISTAIRGGLITECSVITIVASLATLGIATLLRFL